MTTEYVAYLPTQPVFLSPQYLLCGPFFVFELFAYSVFI